MQQPAFLTAPDPHGRRALIEAAKAWQPLYRVGGGNPLPRIPGISHDDAGILGSHMCVSRRPFLLNAKIWVRGPFSPPPPSATAVAVVAFAMWVFPVWGSWIERNRRAA